jgi:hypothetical protein
MPKFIALTTAKRLNTTPVPDFINAEQINVMRRYCENGLHYTLIRVGIVAYYVQESPLEIMAMIEQ